MDDDDKAALARQGLKAFELARPREISRRIKGSMKGAAGNVALRGIAVIGRLTGNAPERSPARATAVAAVDFNHMPEDWDVGDQADFDEKLRRAAAQKPPTSVGEVASDASAPLVTGDGGGAHLEELRRSFPEASRQLAMLIFNCVDLLEELADDVEGSPAPAPELERKERLLTRIAQLIEPQAGVALTSFVAHVVDLSRQSRK